MPFSLFQSLGLCLVCWFLYYIYTRARKPQLPPGPRGYPFIGNLYDVPAKPHQWITLTAMGRRYNSDIISLNLAGDTVIVLNSLAATDALLEERSAIFSDRPEFAMLNDLVGFHWHFAFMRYGARWKAHRKLFMQHFKPSQALLHRPAELHAARVLLGRLLDSPAKFERHLRHMAGMVILSSVYGIDIDPEDDPHVAVSEKALHAMAMTGNRGSFLVDSLPFLQYVPEWLPGTGFKKLAREWRDVVAAMPQVPFDYVRRSRAAGMARSSIASRVLDEIEESGLTDAERKEREETLCNTLGAAYGAAGADTTVSALGSFMLAMTIYPEVQKKAQVAIDAVVGSGRLPDFQDDIPYIDAVVREVLRWRPVTPLAAPHAATEDSYAYKGYYIPAGAVVVGNTWAILHDEETFGPETDKFIPERWLTEDGKINTAMREPSAAFGFGRRICPGRDMAQWSVWICAVSILSMFNITKTVDENGMPIEPSEEYSAGLLSYPVPHKCDILPRSEAARAMIRAALSS
ncbi:cytochrome P450 [Mycena filopes]|nr:cytochrome P450 [Mycena filopes]